MGEDWFRVVTLVDPHDRTQELRRLGNELVSPKGQRYQIVDGIARFVGTTDPRQLQTAQSFGFKWTKMRDWGFTPAQTEANWHFLSEAFGWETTRELKSLVSGKTLLDVGCGSGVGMNQYIEWPLIAVGVDISSAVDICRSRFSGRENTMFIQADLAALPFRDDTFDVVWSGGVLHHTPDTFQALGAIARHVKRGGKIIFYVYAKKAPLRECADEHIRAQMSPLPGEEAWRRMEALTEFARTLAAVDVELVVNEDVPELGFKRGTYKVQRFVYDNMLKGYWNPDFSFDENVMVNFDWYHPAYSHRQTPEQVRDWLATLGFEGVTMKETASGIGVVATRA